MPRPARKKMSAKKIKNPYESYCAVLRAWAVEVPKDMLGEPARERLLDAMLRLFETLDGAGLRGPLAASFKKDLRAVKPYFAVLLGAMRWQLLALDLPMPEIAASFAPYVLALAAARWLQIWLAGDTARLMAAIDRDVGRLDIAVQQFMR